MIKKAVLPLLTAPFLMVFSINSFAWSEAPGSSISANAWHNGFRGSFFADYSSSYATCGKNVDPMSDCISKHQSGTSAIVSTYISLRGDDGYVYSTTSSTGTTPSGGWSTSKTAMRMPVEDFKLNPTSRPPGAAPDEPVYNQKKTDEECSSENGSSFTTKDPAIYNYLNSGGSVRTHGGACSVSLGGGVSVCTGSGESMECSIPIESSSTGQNSKPNIGIEGALLPPDQPQVDPDYSTPDYLSPLPGGCSDPSSCVTIGDTSYLVDWDSAPDYFSYVDSNGNTHSNPSSGGGGGSGSGDPIDPTYPGGDAGGGGDSGNDDAGDNNSGGSSGGGSTVPDFEFDESGIIEAIRSSGQSNRNAINALSNDVTGAISDQTNDLNAATSAQTDALNSTLNSQTNSLTNSLDGQTDDLTSALENQTGTITNSLDALGTTFTDALNGLGLGSGNDDSGDGDGEDGEGDGLLGGISKLLNKMVDKVASRFTEDLGDGNDLFNSSGMDDTLDGAALQEQEHGDEISSLMDEIGEDASSGIAEQVTSRLPSLPSGGCVPLQFGPMEISCQAFNTIKLWLTWIIYFWTVVSIVDTFFRSEQRTA